MAEIPVNGNVLKWARELRALSVTDAAIRLKITEAELRAYELSQRIPTLGTLGEISKKYKIPLASLLMPQPLPPVKRPADHRTRPNAKPLTIGTLLALEEVTEALDAFESVAEETSNIVPQLNITSATLKDDPEKIAARERARFGVTFEDQKEWRSLSEARIYWRQLIEKRGVFTYMIAMPPEEISGFSLLRNRVAAICANDNEPSEGAKIFTLFHEYCHLLLRNAGISDENDNNRVEHFCNQFAACFLVPKRALAASIQGVTLPHEFSASQVNNLAAQFRVSNRAVALRLEKTGFAPVGFYERCTGSWGIPQKRKMSLKKGKPNQIRIRLKRVGKLHARTVLSAITHRAMNSFDGSQLIGLRPKSFTKLRAELG